MAGALGGLACVSQIHLSPLLSTRGCAGPCLISASESENKTRPHHPQGSRPEAQLRGRVCHGLPGQPRAGALPSLSICFPSVGPPAGCGRGEEQPWGLCARVDSGCPCAFLCGLGGHPPRGPPLPPPVRLILCYVSPCPAVPPRVTLPPHLPGPVLLGAPVRLTCNATGRPSPTLMWLKDGNPVSTAGTLGLQVSRAGRPGSPPCCLRGLQERRPGPGSCEGRGGGDPPRQLAGGREADC